MTSLSVHTLRCEYRTNPIGIDVEKPRLFWKLESRLQDVFQTDYRITAALSEEGLESEAPDLWDSGKVSSDQSVQVEYGGPKLAPRQRVWWRVEVWDSHGKRALSRPAYFEIGLMNTAEWQAEWIGSWQFGAPKTQAPSPLLRKSFNVDQPVVQARLYITSLGLYECTVNGKPVSEDCLTPGWTEYRKRILYQTYDVTPHISQGENVLGAMLGDGWYCGHVSWLPRQFFGDRPKLLAQLEILHADGSYTRICSDGSWTCHPGPILENDILMGETYDSAHEKPGWNLEGYKEDVHWLPVEVFPVPDLILQGQIGEPVKRHELIKPVATSYVHGRAIVNMGQNMVGRVRLTLHNQPKGQTITLKHAEVLNPDGTLYTTNLRGAKQQIVYTCKGESIEVYEPHFTFQGFQYVEINGHHGEIAEDTIVGIVMHSGMEVTGHFECSEPLLNQLQHNILWGQKGNFVDLPTDCPQRDERLGWMGDAQVFIRTAAYNMDVAGFFNRWLQTVEDSQSSKGEYPMYAPLASPNPTDADGGPAWADAGVICPYIIHLCYADKRQVSDRYESMARFIQSMVDAAPNLIRVDRDRGGWRGFGDWLSINAYTPEDLIGTAFFAYCLQLMSEMALAIGKNEDAEKYKAEHERVKSAYVEKFLSGESPEALTSQTGCILTLHFHLCPAEMRSVVSDALVKDIESRGMHLSAGFVGSSYLNDALTSTGHLDTAYALLNQKTWPSWLYAVTKGATTIWERWDGWTEENGYQDPGMNSFNHYAYGAIGDWLYRTVAGIDADPLDPGYHHIIMAPQPGGGLSHISAKLETLYGTVKSSWSVGNGAFTWEVEVPPNTHATIYIPGTNAKHNELVIENGTLEVGSGRYLFTSSV